MLATALKSDVWELSEPEAEKLATAIGKVQAEYGVKFDPKTQAWINLAMCAGTIYGSRLLVHNALREKKPKAAKPVARAPGDPIPMSEVSDHQPAQSVREGFGPVVMPSRAQTFTPGGAAGL